MGLFSLIAQALTHDKIGMVAALRPGNIVAFGRYPGGGAGTAEILEWRVLASDGRKALLLAERSPASRPYHHGLAAAEWENCDLRQWLNREFFEEAFTGPEKKQILDASSVSAGDIFSGGSSAVKNQFPENTPHVPGDRVFALSEAEARRCFDRAEEARCPDFYEDARTGSGTGNGSGWWLRSPGRLAGCVAYVDARGCLREHGTNVFMPGIAVRPAIWIRPDGPLTVLRTAENGEQKTSSGLKFAGRECGSTPEFQESSAETMPVFKLEGTVPGAIRSDADMTTVNREVAETAFKKQKRNLTLFLKNRGFKKYRTNAYIRRNAVDVLEYLNLQKEQYGSKTLTVNYALIPLYVPHDFLSFDLGDRLGMLICGRDVWWDFANDRVAEISFRNIMKAVDEILLPWFLKHASGEAIKTELHKLKNEAASYGGGLSDNQRNWLECLDRSSFDPEIIRRNLEVFGIAGLQPWKSVSD